MSRSPQGRRWGVYLTFTGVLREAAAPAKSINQTRKARAVQAHFLSAMNAAAANARDTL